MTNDPRSGLTEEQIQQLREKLLQTRHTLLGRSRRAVVEEPAFADQPRGDAADQAEAGFEQGLQADLGERDRQLLQAVEEALARLERGSYGLSERSGEAIGFDRLRVQPWAVRTEEEQELLEREASGREPRTQL